MHYKNIFIVEIATSKLRFFNGTPWILTLKVQKNKVTIPFAKASVKGLFLKNHVVHKHLNILKRKIVSLISICGIFSVLCSHIYNFIYFLGVRYLNKI